METDRVGDGMEAAAARGGWPNGLPSRCKA